MKMQMGFGKLFFIILVLYDTLVHEQEQNFIRGREAGGKEAGSGE